jgi:hypothetical protein
VNEQHKNHQSFKFFKTSNIHQISQTKIPFCLDFHADHESKLIFHSECLYREKSIAWAKASKAEAWSRD